MSVQDGKLVSIEYTLRLDDMSVVETNAGEKPLQYTQGAHEVLPGLEQALTGLDVGDTRRVTVPAEQGYGPVDPNGFHEVEKHLVPEGAREVGTVLLAKGRNGEERCLRVHEVREQTVVVDLNHPLAGKTLIFDVKVLSVE
jgi:FKBP-type peptidyl-prolyl cis-trans isomerase SlyD